MVPAEQMHRPATQSWVGAQVFPQPPQLRGSFCTSRQVAPQSMLPGEHAQRPPRQISKSAQRWPQAAQLRGSLKRFTHTPEQLAVVPGHVAVHRPAEQA